MVIWTGYCLGTLMYNIPYTASVQHIIYILTPPHYNRPSQLKKPLPTHFLSLLFIFPTLTLTYLFSRKPETLKSQALQLYTQLCFT